jgi:hypothetical protein
LQPSFNGFIGILFDHAIVAAVAATFF